MSKLHVVLHGPLGLLLLQLELHAPSPTTHTRQCTEGVQMLRDSQYPGCCKTRDPDQGAFQEGIFPILCDC